VLQALQRTYDFVFGGCRHRSLSRPFTLSSQTYEVCLNCGRKFAYSLDAMSLIEDENRRPLLNWESSCDFDPRLPG